MNPDTISNELLVQLIERLVHVEERVSENIPDPDDLAWLRAEIQRKREIAQFWKDQRARLATAGILGSFGILGSVCWYAVTQFVAKGGTQ